MLYGRTRATGCPNPTSLNEILWKFRWQVIIGRNRCIYCEHLHPCACTTFRSKRISCLFCQIASFQGSFLWCKSRLTAHFITFRVEVPGEQKCYFLLRIFFFSYSSTSHYISGFGEAFSEPPLHVLEGATHV